MIIKTCQTCGRTFKQQSHNHKFCSDSCRDKARYKEKTWFEIEWEAWKRDFALQKHVAKS